MLSNKQLEELRKLAAANIDAALMAAARFGAAKTADYAQAIKRASELLEYEAEGLKESHAPYGKWEGEQAAKADYDEFKKVAKTLRELVG
jgi:hypothetical protein